MRIGSYYQSGLISDRLFFTLIGAAGMFTAYFFDFSLLGKCPKAVYILIVTSALMIVIFYDQITGAAFYSKYIILLFPLAFSMIIFSMKNKGYRGLLCCVAAFALPSFIALKIPSLSGFLIFAVSGIVLLTIANFKNRFGINRKAGLLLTLIPAVFFSFLFIVAAKDRIIMVLNPYSDPQGYGYWSVMTRELLSGAKFFGQGDIPTDFSLNLMIFYSDSFLTAVTVLFGWGVFILITTASLLFIIKGFALCFKQKTTLDFISQCPS